MPLQGVGPAIGQPVFRMSLSFSLVEMIQSVKADKVGPALQREFFEKSAKPLATKQAK